MRKNPKLRSRALRYTNAVHAAGPMLDHETRAVLIALGSHLSQQDWIVWPSVRRLARMTELSERTVKRRRKEIIEEHKLAEVAQYYGDRRAASWPDEANVEGLEGLIPRKMRRWRKGGRPPLSLKLDFVALLKLRRGRLDSDRTAFADSSTRVTGSHESMVTGGHETGGTWVTASHPK